MHDGAGVLALPLRRDDDSENANDIADKRVGKTQQADARAHPPRAEIQVADQQRQRRERHQGAHARARRRHVVGVGTIGREELGAVAQHVDADEMRAAERHLDHPQPQVESGRVEDIERDRKNHEQERKRRRPSPAPAAGQRQHAPRKQQQPKHRDARLLQHVAEQMQRESAEHRDGRTTRRRRAVVRRLVAHIAPEQPERHAEDQPAVLAFRLRI